MAQFDDLQVTGDFNVQGSTDLGQTQTGAMSIGPGYIQFAGAPVGSKAGFMLSNTTNAPANSEGVVLFWHTDGRPALRLPGGQILFILTSTF